MKEFDYYIFIDYSENLLGYIIVEFNKIKSLLPKISKIKHYKEVSKKSQYLKAIKSSFQKSDILNHLFSFKIKKVIQTLEIYTDIAEFIKSNRNRSIFVSIDDKQSSNFEKLVNIFNEEKVFIVKEGKLRKGSMEQRISLIIDNLLNLDRVKDG